MPTREEDRAFYKNVLAHKEEEVFPHMPWDKRSSSRNKDLVHQALDKYDMIIDSLESNVSFRHLYHNYRRSLQTLPCRNLFPLTFRAPPTLTPMATSRKGAATTKGNPSLR